jgi:class 3 adenylate cyclase
MNAGDRATAAIARGDLITAYDETISAIAEGDSSSAIRHQQVLAVARMGDTDRAMLLFQTYGLDRSEDVHQRTIGARLLKDRALDLPPGPERDAALETAFDTYRALFEDSGDPYPGINAASLAALAGRGDDARVIAARILAHPHVIHPQDYYTAATRAEALLIQGQVEAAADALIQAAAMIGNDAGARSTTCRQIALVARHLGLDDAAIDHLLAAVRPPRAIHFCGHIFAADPVREGALRAEIDAYLTQENIGFAYGALAAGGDILIAEAILALGGELHVVLPFAVEDFIAQSVRPAGEAWVERFEHCMAAAASRTLATEMVYVGDPEQYSYSSRVAMGLAILRAQHLGNAPEQFALWDGVLTGGPAGTGADVATWRAQGGGTHSIDPGRVDRTLTRPPAQGAGEHERALAAIIFTDFPGFSRLTEAVLPIFWDGVMRRIADVLDQHEGKVLCRNSWGDALYAVASSAAGAAEIALALQSRLREFDYGTIGLADSGGMRIGVHYGPAYRMFDHITGRMNFYGTEVSRAARIEPVTPPGTVFVTEPFAAILALEAPDDFQCRYVGRIELAKGYGTYPMYRLTRVRASQ